MRLLFIGLLLLFFISAPSIAQSAQPAQPTPLNGQPAVTQPSLTPELVLERLLTSPQVQADWFDRSFLNQVPLPQIEQILAELKASLGAYQSLEALGDGYRLQFERGSLRATIALNQRGQIVGLLFQPGAIALSDAVQQLKQLPGQVNFLVLEGERELAALQPDRPLAVGSTFKLAVLLALKQQIAAGKHTWSEVVNLRPEWKSLPSGMLQDWEDGSPLTLQTLANLMISISDNTAADSLIHFVGQAAIEPLTARNRPFLTTRQLFLLKSPENTELRQRYLNGSEAEQRSILQTLDRQPLPKTFHTDPTALAIEWLFTSRELCGLIAQTADLPSVSINPGLARPQDWARIAYKGGSEPGVLNYTTWLQAKNGKTYCATVTWNHTEALDADRLTTIFLGMLETLRIQAQS